MMKKYFRNSAWIGLLFGSCLAYHAQAATAATLTPSGVSSTTSFAAGTGWALNFSGTQAQPLNTSSAAQTITLTATGGNVVLYSLGVDSGDFTLLNNTCTPNLGMMYGTNNQVCTFDVKFTPTKSGIRYGEVYIRSDASNSPVVYLYGNAALTQAQTLTISAPDSVTYTNQGTFQATASSSVPALTSSIVLSATGACSNSGTTVNVTDGGACTITATQAGDTTYSPATATKTVTINKATQTIAFAPPSTVSFRQGGTFTVTGSSSAAQSPITYASGNADRCSVDPNSGVVTMVSMGTCPLTASQAGNSRYNPASATANVQLTTLATQQINFAPASPVQYSANGTFTLSATSTSGLTTFTYSLQQGQTSTCTVSGSTVTMTGVGSCYLTATQPGDGTYASASANATVVIGKGNQTITFAPPSTQTFVANGTFNVSATASSGLTNFTYRTDTTAVCSVNGSTVTMIATGACVLNVSQPGDANFNPASASATVNLTQAGGGTADCVAQGLLNSEVAMDWGSGSLKTFFINPGTSYSFILTPNAGDYGRITTVYGGSQKVISISTKQCDFSADLANTRCLTTGTDPAIGYSTSASRYYCPLTPGQTYYVNIRNALISGTGLPYYPIQDSCGTICQFSITY